MVYRLCAFAWEGKRNKVSAMELLRINFPENWLFKFNFTSRLNFCHGELDLTTQSFQQWLSLITSTTYVMKIWRTSLFPVRKKHSFLRIFLPETITLNEQAEIFIILLYLLLLLNLFLQSFLPISSLNMFYPRSTDCPSSQFPTPHSI